VQPSRLRTLGELRLDAPLAALLGGRRKELVLLAYLARSPARGTSREELADLLWGATAESNARHSLRQALHRLRQVVGEGLEVGPVEVRIVAGAIELDATLFDAEIAAGSWEAAVSRWGGDFLPGLEDAGGEMYQAWLEAEREALRRRLRLALERLGAEAAARGAWNDAVRWAERCVVAAPDDSAAQQRLREWISLAGRAPTRQAGFAALFAPDMVGRGAAFGELVAGWRAAEAGAGAALFVVGDDGIGKTRLVQEFARWAGDRDPPALVLATAGTQHEREDV
jgi:DNA-binding SARP family transcriptional activator